MSLGKAALLMALSIAAFLALSVKEHREALKEWEVVVADLKRQLVRTRGEVADLKVLNASLGQEKPPERVGEMRFAAAELEKASALLSDERDWANALQRDLHLAHKTIENLKEQPSTGSVDVTPAADQSAAGDSGQLVEARQQITTLAHEVGQARQEIQRLKEQSATALEQASRRAREREAALNRDLRSARRELQRVSEKREMAAGPGGQPVAAHATDGDRAQRSAEAPIR